MHLLLVAVLQRAQLGPIVVQHTIARGNGATRHWAHRRSMLRRLRSVAARSIGGAHSSLWAVLISCLCVFVLSLYPAGWNVGTHAGLFGVEEEAAARSQEERAESEAAQGIADGDREAAHQRAIDMEAQDAVRHQTHNHAQHTADETASSCAVAHCFTRACVCPVQSSEFALVARRNFRFHLVMSACAMYFSMLLTNWGSMSAAEDVDLNGGDLNGRAYDLSAESMYVKIISQWLTMILFTWSVMAPALCKGRDFG